MRRGGWLVHKTAESQGALLQEKAWMRGALHDLSQPLTALECRLYLGMMGTGDGPQADAAEMRTSVEESLQQCERIMVMVRAMQDHLTRNN